MRCKLLLSLPSTLENDAFHLTLSLVMFSLCRYRQTSARTFMIQPMTQHFRIFVLVLVVAISAGCSKHAAPAPDEPWVTDGEVVRGEASAGGFQTRYSSYFTDAQLNKIVEARTGAHEGHGEYTFSGARLIAYKGSALER